jgi:hypothetical protein
MLVRRHSELGRILCIALACLAVCATVANRTTAHGSPKQWAVVNPLAGERLRATRITASVSLTRAASGATTVRRPRAGRPGCLSTHAGGGQYH